MKFPYIHSLLAAFSIQVALGQELTIDWGTSIFPPGSIIDSNGTPITLGDGNFTDGGYSIELGAFDGSSSPGGVFTPTAANTSSWVGNWRVFDAIVASDEDSADFLNPGDPTTFAGSDVLTSDNFSLSGDAAVDPSYEFAQGTQAYVFIRNSNATTSGSEWLLYTRTGGADSWQYPFVSPESHNPADDLVWEVQDADSAVWGGINQGTTQGGGVHPYVENDYLVQTFTFPVPEPTTVLLAGLGSLFLLRRQRNQ